MKEKTLLQFENAADLEAYLKDHGYPEVFRRYKDGVILTDGKRDFALIAGKGHICPDSVAFTKNLEDDMDADDFQDPNLLHDIYLWEYGSGGFYWYRAKELVIEKTTDGEDSFKLLMDIGTFESEFIN